MKPPSPLLVAAAGLLGLLSLPLVLVLPEFGIPLLLVSLRVLGRRYAWAAAANARIDAWWASARRWSRRHPVLAGLIVLALVAVLVLLAMHALA